MSLWCMKFAQANNKAFISLFPKMTTGRLGDCSIHIDHEQRSYAVILSNNPVQKSGVDCFYRCRYSHVTVLSYGSSALTFCRIQGVWPLTGLATLSSSSAKSSEWLSSASRPGRFYTSSVSWRLWNFQMVLPPATAVTRFTSATISHIASRLETKAFS